MSEKTVKLSGWSRQERPEENDEIQFHRQLLIEIVYGLFYKKKKYLEKMGMPSQPVTLKEIWLEFCSRRQMLKSIKEWPWGWHEKRWVDRRVNECFVGDTLIQTDREKMKIEDLREGDIIFGIAEGRKVSSEVLAWHPIAFKGNLVELSFEREKLLCTPDHLFLTLNGWIEASRVTPYTVLVRQRKPTIQATMAKTQPRRLNESFPPSHLECNQITCTTHGLKTHDAMGCISQQSASKNENRNTINRNGQGVFGGDNRWRRNDINFSAIRQEKEEAFSLCTKTVHFKHVGRIEQLDTQKTKNITIASTKAEIKSEVENSLRTSPFRIHSGTSFADYIAVFGNKKETGTIGSKLFRASQKTFGKRVLQSRNRVSGANQEFEPARILEKRFIPFKGIVYDLTTTIGNYIANNIVVHNCATAKYAEDGVPRVASTTAGKYEPNPEYAKYVQNQSIIGDEENEV